MGKLSAIKIFLDKTLSFLGELWWFLARLWRTIWGWLRVRLPFVKALVRRHTRNPSTVFVDAAITILVLYVIFGTLGYFFIYTKKSETRFAETLAILYPLPAAKVNDSLVWSHKFLERLRFLSTFNSNAPTDSQTVTPTAQELRERVLAGVIEDQIIFLEAKKRGIRVTEDELNRALEKQGEVKEVKKKIAELYGMSLADFKEVVAEQVLKEKVKNSVITRIRVRHVLVSTQQVANTAKQQLESGKSFEEVSKEFSQDAGTKDLGGDLGYWRKSELASQIAPGFEEAAFALALNQISGVVQSQYGFHVIQVTERNGDNLQTYEEWYKTTQDSYQVKRYIKI